MTKPRTRMRGLGAILAMVLGSSILAGAAVAVTATTAGAGEDGASGALLKVCKNWTASSLVTVDNLDENSVPTPFSFHVTGPDVDETVFAEAGSCSSPISIDPGDTYTVTETAEPWYEVTDITNAPSTPAGDVTPSGTMFPYYPADSVSAYVSASAGTLAGVQFTDQLVTGQVEICKADVAGDTLSGTYSFTLSNTSEESDVSGGLTWSLPESVTISAGGTSCSNLITVPAGDMEVTELGSNLYVTGITATLDGPGGTDELVTDDTIAGTSVSEVLADSDVTPPSPNVTVVTYTDATVGLEVCKYWDESPWVQPQGPSTEYSFTETASGAAGPTAGTSFDLTIDQCSTPQPYRPGTTVTITEGVTPGTEAYSIDASGDMTVVTNYPDLPNRTEQIVVGASSGQGSTPEATSNGNYAEVDFYDGLAYPSNLKICKDAPAGSGPFTFTVSGPQYVPEYLASGASNPAWFEGEIAPGSFTVTVPANECEFATPTINSLNAGAPGPDEFLLPYNSTQLVTESGTSGFAASSIALSSSFSDVGVWEGGVFELTTEPVLSNITLGSSGGSSSADVTMSEGPSETDVTWTNVDPPSAPSAPVTVANPGGSNAGTTTAPTLPEAIAVSKAVTVLNSSSHIRSELTKFEHQYLKLDRAIKAMEKALRSAKLTKAERAQDLRQLAHLRVERQRLAFRIVKLTL